MYDSPNNSLQNPLLKMPPSVHDEFPSSPGKVSAAEQYVDDLYEIEVTIDKEMEEDPSQDMPVAQQTSSGLSFYSSVDVSLETGEVVFGAVLTVLYLKCDKLAGTDSQPGFFHRNDSYIGHSM